MTTQKRRAYATAGLSYRQGAGYDFRRGDRIDHRMPEELVAACVRRVEASYDKPTDVAPIYAAEAVSHRTHTVSIDFRPGERVDGTGVPEAIVADWIKTGHATTEEPE